MTFSEFASTHSVFRLRGGPFDGQGVPTASYEAWPNTIRMPRADRGDALYQMRIGSLEIYDYVGDVDSASAIELQRQPGLRRAPVQPEGTE